MNQPLFHLSSERPARPWRRALAWLGFLAPFFYVSYGLANHLAAQRAAVPSVVFDWERHVPFWDWTIYPYWSLNAFYGLSLFLCAGRHVLDRHAARLLSAQVVAVACFIAFPLQFSFGQPAAEGAAGWLFAALRSFDRPFNQAPSLHIALVVILWDLYRRLIHGRIARALLHGWSLAICGSVLTTWQHHFIDIPTGALLGLLCVWALPLERRVSMAQTWSLSTDARRRRLAACYAAGCAAFASAAAGLAASGQPAGLWLLWPAVSLAGVALLYLGFGSRGFQADAAGRLPWAVRLLLGPYLAGARLNALAWTRGLPALRALDGGVWIASLARLPAALQTVDGAASAANAGPAAAPSLSTLPQALTEAPLRSVWILGLCPEVPAALPTALLQQTRCQPMLDLVPARPGELRRAAAWIDGRLARGDAVLVACALGFSRSAAVAACWLVTSGRARSVDDALAQLFRAHPRAVLGADWVQALRQACEPGHAADATPKPPAPTPRLKTLGSP